MGGWDHWAGVTGSLWEAGITGLESLGGYAVTSYRRYNRCHCVKVPAVRYGRAPSQRLAPWISGTGALRSQWPDRGSTPRTAARSDLGPPSRTLPPPEPPKSPVRATSASGQSWHRTDLFVARCRLPSGARDCTHRPPIQRGFLGRAGESSSGVGQRVGWGGPGGDGL